MIEDKRVDQRIKETVAVVEATHTEKFFLWTEWAADSDFNHVRNPYNKVQWEQLSDGFTQRIGTIDGRPVQLCVFWARIHGQLVMFWEQTSQVTDSVMAEEFIEKELFGGKLPTYDGGGRTATFDAMNFHNALSAVEEAAEKAGLKARVKQKWVGR